LTRLFAEHRVIAWRWTMDCQWRIRRSWPFFEYAFPVFVPS